MVIIISYNKQTWNEYNDSQTADENLANGAIISADRLNHMEDGIGNNDTNKVTDNKDGTEQLNGVQVQPYNKLSDNVGGRNLLPGTSGTLQTVTNASGYNANLPAITPVVTTIDNDTIYTARAWMSPASHDIRIVLAWSDSSGTWNYGNGSSISAGTSGYATWTGTVPAGSTLQNVQIAFTTQQSAPSSVSYKEMKLEQGSIATDWTPAPEDKVNVSDMRKPASDVVGLEDVPQAVVHSELTSGIDLDTVLTPGVYPFIEASFTNYIDTAVHWGYLVVTSEGNIVTQTAYTTGPAQPLYRMKSGFPASWSPWVRRADDSKVAHLSGANNFDTVPTYGTSNKPFAINDTGATTARPTGQAVGYQYFDTTLNKPIWYNGSDWVDSTGTTV